MLTEVVVERQVENGWEPVTLNDQTEEGYFRVYNPFTKQFDIETCLDHAKHRVAMHIHAINHHKKVGGELVMKHTTRL